jgi:D-3-phosphoglycerate dehydrogenase
LNNFQKYNGPVSTFEFSFFVVFRGYFMPIVLIEEDKILRVIEAILDPRVSLERLAAFADFNSTAVDDFPEWLAQTRRDLVGLCPSEVRFVKTQEELLEHLPDADVLITEGLKVGERELLRAPKLRVIHQFGTQVSHIDTKSCSKRGIALQTLRRRTNIAMAEHTMMLCLNLAKRFAFANRWVSVDDLNRHGVQYKPYDTRFTPNANYMRLSDLRTLHGSNLGLLGFGEIAQEVSKMAQVFGMNVLCHKANPLDEAEQARHGVKCVSLHELLERSEFLSLHVPLTESTRAMVGHAELMRMPKGSFLINTARAAIVEHDALVQALQCEHIAGAAFDVHYSEPVESDEVLLSLPNFLATPHVGGASRMNVLMDIKTLLQNCLPLISSQLHLSIT